MSRLGLVIFSVLACSQAHTIAQQRSATDFCPRPAAGSAVPEPAELRSENGVLEVELAYRNFTGADGETRYCYVSKDGSQAPTLRLKPGDVLILRLKNELTATSQSRMATAPSGHPAAPWVMGASGDPVSQAMTHPCANPTMTPDSTNLHFHGLSVPAV